MSIGVEEKRIKEVYARRAANSRYTWFSRGELWMLHGRERSVLDALRRHGIEDLSSSVVLDVGCGYGQWLADLLEWGARPENLLGIDLLPERIATARSRLPDQVTLLVGSAAELPPATGTCDIVVLSTVFSSILNEPARAQIAAEIFRVLRPTGVVIWYDFFVDNPRNRDVRGVSKRRIAELFPNFALDLRRATLAPPIARWVAPRSWLACGVLEALPFLRTHYVGVLRRI